MCGRGVAGGLLTFAKVSRKRPAHQEQIVNTIADLGPVRRDLSAAKKDVAERRGGSAGGCFGRDGADGPFERSGGLAA